MRNIPLELNQMFNEMHSNNEFRLLDGQPYFESKFHDSEIDVRHRGRVLIDGTEERLNLDDGSWSVDGDTRFAVAVNGVVAVNSSGITFRGNQAAKITPKYPFYECGSIREVVKIVSTEVAGKRNTRFPLVLLETLDNAYNDIDDLETEYNMIMYIVCETDKDMTPKERYQVSYNELLLPYWDMIERYLYRYNYVMTEPEITFRERWGSGGLYYRKDNVFNDQVDALEIKLKLKFNNC